MVAHDHQLLEGVHYVSYDARASLLVTQEDTDGEPLGASRVTLVENLLPVPNTELAGVRKLYQLPTAPVLCQSLTS